MRQGLLAIALLFGAALSVTRADYIIIIANISQSKAEPDGMGVMGQAGAMGAMGAKGGAANLGSQIGFTGGGGALGDGLKQMGGSPMSGEMGMMGAQGGPAPVRAMAVVESKNRLFMQTYGEKNIAKISHHWGDSWLWAYKVDLQILSGRDKKTALPPVAERFKDEYRRVMSSKPSSQQLLDLAEWALTHGLIAEFEKAMTELGKIDKTHPSATAFDKVKAALGTKLTSMAHADKLKQSAFKAFKIASNDYFALLHKWREDSQEVVHRLTYLKENLIGFYYWHALRGKVLPMPKEKLVAVLAPLGEGSDTFFKHHSLFDSVALTADSFYSPRHNVAVFSARRLDKPFEGVVKTAEGLWTVYNRDRILSFNYRPHFDRPEGELQVAQTYSVLLKAMEDEGERASVSHTGTRQLLVGAGLIPGNVDLPRWLQNGVGNFMHVPYGSPWRGFGSPNWSLYLSFQDLKKSKKLDAPEKLLRQVITDRLFDEGNKRNPSLKARSTAWALYYYLAQKKLKELDSFYLELSRLPRDLELDADSLLDCFARAFGCVDSSNRRSEEKLNELADSWMSYIMDEVKLDLEVHPILVAIYKLQNEIANELKESEKPKTVAPGDGTPGASP